ncbi:MAG TPA: hypothetical protein GYA06_06830 [Chloroflexi bacterium]|jgi:hypothetical protein|nr:hypothetical protein [Chloroflexota bacterium]HPO58038.1 hypothetical protein [Anaerolineaceae bacterium]
MDYGMIGKIEKGKRYAQEPERFHFQTIQVVVDGDNNPHMVTYNRGEWGCDCHFFQTRGRCGHTIALEYLLQGMLDQQPVSS